MGDHFETSESAAGTLMNRTINDPPAFTTARGVDLASATCTHSLLRCHSLGVFRPSTQWWYTRNTNTTNEDGNAPAHDSYHFGGFSSDIALAGDWDGDGDETNGIYRPSTREFHLSNSPGGGLVASFACGNNGDLPLAGDWDGDGDDTWGLYRPSTAEFYISNALSCSGILGPFQYGNAGGGDKPLAGDWNGNGHDTIGVYRAAASDFYLSDDLTSTTYSFHYGAAGDTPIVGDWNGNRTDTAGVWRNAFFYLKNSHSGGGGDISLNFGVNTDKPRVGDWRD
jgi:hypothetical protein